MPQAVIFDLDGTLLNTLADITAAMNHALAVRGYPAATLDEVRTRVGWGLSTLVTRSLPEGSSGDADLVQAVARGTRAYYLEHPVVETVPYPGVLDLVAELSRGGYRLAVLSNKPDELVQPIVAELLDPVVRAAAPDRGGFAAVMGRKDGDPHKPDPTTTRRILEQLDVSPEDTAFVGDSEIDIETAVAAGCIAVGVAWGFREPEALIAAGADHVCYSIEELRQVLELEHKEETV
ncbi:MAG: HAD-IA family hydrolase [Alkalispirochaeta sp.]